MENIDQYWRTSSYSGNGGECAEVGTGADRGSVTIRDTKDRQGPILRFAPSTWRRFTGQVKRQLAS